MKKLILLSAATIMMTASMTAAGDTHANIKVGGECEMCKARIEKAAKSVKGVTTAVWEKGSKQLHVHFDNTKTTLEAVTSAIAASGHDAADKKAPTATYNALPSCCKYRK
jgi:Cu(I)/Ag(I) efflux system membrane fusion protein